MIDEMMIVPWIESMVVVVVVNIFLIQKSFSLSLSPGKQLATIAMERAECWASCASPLLRIIQPNIGRREVVSVVYIIWGLLLLLRLLPGGGGGWCASKSLLWTNL